MQCSYYISQQQRGFSNSLCSPSLEEKPTKIPGWSVYDRYWLLNTRNRLKWFYTKIINNINTSFTRRSRHGKSLKTRLIFLVFRQKTNNINNINNITYEQTSTSSPQEAVPTKCCPSKMIWFVVVNWFIVLLWDYNSAKIPMLTRLLDKKAFV